MIKTIGLIMIVTSCSMMGLSFHQEMVSRKVSLKDHITALEMMRTELYYRNTPLEDVLLQLGSVCQKSTIAFYQKSFDAAVSGLAFSTAAGKQFDLLKKEKLQTEDIEAIRSACLVLGRYDCAVQTERIASAVKMLEQNLENLQNELSSRGRVYKAAGATVGIIMALIVI